MSLIGYARVSTDLQSDDSQLDDLNAAGCEKIFVDHGVSGKLARRPQLDACLEYLRPGDVLVITRLSRAMRSLRDLLNVAHDLRERGIGLKVLKQDIDTTNATGRFLFHILAAVDELQREIIVESTREGLKSARARGRVGGGKPKLPGPKAKLARQLYDELEPEASPGCPLCNGTGSVAGKPCPCRKRRYTVAQIADMLSVSRATVYRTLDRLEGKAKETA